MSHIMTYYLLPRSNLLSQKYIDCILTDEVPGPVISFSLSNYLYEIKGELESQEKDWDIFKKYTNPYEYIHTQIPQRKKCVSKYKPLSRSYFKMIEIIRLFDLYYEGFSNDSSSVDIAQQSDLRQGIPFGNSRLAPSVPDSSACTTSKDDLGFTAPLVSVRSTQLAPGGCGVPVKPSVKGSEEGPPTEQPSLSSSADNPLRGSSKDDLGFSIREPVGFSTLPSERQSRSRLSAHSGALTPKGAEELNVPLYDTPPQTPYYSTMRNRTLRPVRSFHLAEGPGGFIEAFSGVRKCSQDLYVGMTILDENNDPNIPAWKKTEHFLRQNKNVFIEKGATGTGNILAIENLEYCRKKYGSSMDLITADGGFDFSLDFNQQEIIISRLLYAQMTFAILLQRQGGCFILKIFDAFMQHSIDILFILSSFYEKTYIIKPQTSRYANSEKYVVCKNFLFSSVDSHYPILHRTFEKMMASPEKYVHRFMTIPIPLHFVTRLEEYNAIFGQQQIENIHYTISLIKNKNRQDKIENLIKTNVQKCIAWCIKYNVPFFTFTNNVGQQLTTPNIFADREQGPSPAGAQPWAPQSPLGTYV